jgi:hypothetical protein
MDQLVHANMKRAMEQLAYRLDSLGNELIKHQDTVLQGVRQLLEDSHHTEGKENGMQQHQVLAATDYRANSDHFAKFQEPEAALAQADVPQEDLAEKGTDSEDLDPETLRLRHNDSLAAVFFFDHDLDMPAYHPEDDTNKASVAHAITRHKIWSRASVAMVLANTMYIGVEAEFNHAPNIYDAAWPFLVCSQTFCVFFTIELLLHLAAFESPQKALKDSWFRFDAFLVCANILEIWILSPIFRTNGGALKIMNTLRIGRLFKLTRILSILENWPELVTMIKATVLSVRAATCMAALTFGITYVFGCLFHSLLKEEDEFNNQLKAEDRLDWTSLPNVMIALLIDATLLIDPGVYLIKFWYSGRFKLVIAGILYLTYIGLSAMVILQMLIGVLCEVVIRITKNERDGHDIALIKQELTKTVAEIASEPGVVSREEVERVMTRPTSKALLKKLNINRTFFMELQNLLFYSQTKVGIKNVIQLMLICRGDDVATVESVAGGFCYISQELGIMREHMGTMHEHMGSMHEHVVQHMVGARA